MISSTTQSAREMADAIAEGKIFMAWIGKDDLDAPRELSDEQEAAIVNALRNAAATVSRDREAVVSCGVQALLKSGKIMLVCEDCSKNNPEESGHYSEDELRSAPDGRWLCESCYDETEATDEIWWRDAPKIATPAAGYEAGVETVDAMCREYWNFGIDTLGYEGVRWDRANKEEKIVCHARMEAALAALPVQGTQGDLELVWRKGAPPHSWSGEWFIAETTYGDRVVLRSLPKEYTYDFKTADDTYIKADKIKRWMQFPDSDYIAPAPSEAIPVGRDDRQVRRWNDHLKMYVWESVSTPLVLGGDDIQTKSQKDSSRSVESVATECSLRRADLKWCRTEIFGLCEDTEDRYQKMADDTDDGKQGAFARGRVAEAKSIRKAMGEVISERLRDLSPTDGDVA